MLWLSFRLNLKYVSGATVHDLANALEMNNSLRRLLYVSNAMSVGVYLYFTALGFLAELEVGNIMWLGLSNWGEPHMSELNMGNYYLSIHLSVCLSVYLSVRHAAYALMLQISMCCAHSLINHSQFDQSLTVWLITVFECSKDWHTDTSWLDSCPTAK